MKVRLTKRLADFLDGVDLTGLSVGDVVELPPREARILIKEEWGIRVDPETRPVRRRTVQELTEAADRPRRRKGPRTRSAGTDR